MSDESHLFEKLISTKTNKFSELVGILELDPSKDFVGADLRGTDLRGENLSNFDLRGANLANAKLKGCTLPDSAYETAILVDFGISSANNLISEPGNFRYFVQKAILSNRYVKRAGYSLAYIALNPSDEIDELIEYGIVNETSMYVRSFLNEARRIIHSREGENRRIIELFSIGRQTSYPLDRMRLHAVLNEITERAPHLSSFWARRPGV